MLKFGSIALATAVGFTLLVPATAAHAEAGIVSATVVGKPVLKSKQVPVKVRITATGQNVTEVAASLESAKTGGGFATIDALKLVKGTAQNGTWEGTAWLDRYSVGGQYYIGARVTDGTLNDDFFDYKSDDHAGTFTVYRETRLTLAATPAKPRKGSSFKVGGAAATLGKYDGWSALKNQKVQIWWKPKGAKTGRLVATVRTNAKGKWTKSFKATKDGYVAAVFPVSGFYAKKVTAWKLIDVR